MATRDLFNFTTLKSVVPNGMNYRSNWVNNVSYVKNDVVVSGTDNYICISPIGSSNQNPATNPLKWSVLSGNNIPLSNVVFNPLTQNVSGLNSGCNYDITQLGVLNASKVETEQITLQPGSLQTAVIANETFEFANNKKVKFANNAVIESGLGGDVKLVGTTFKFDTLSSDIATNLSTLVYNPTSKEIFYSQPINSLNLSTLSVSTITGCNALFDIGAFSTISASTINANTLYTVSTIDVVNYVSSMNVDAEEMTTSSISLGSITGAGDVFFDAGGSFDMNGKTLNMTQGEIHNVPLIHSQNNQNLVIEGKGSGNVYLSSISTIASKYLYADTIGTSTLTTNTMNTTSSLSRVLQTSSLTLSSIVGSTIQAANWLSTIATNNVSTIASVGILSSINTNVISSQQLNISTVSARAVTGSALVYPSVAVTGSGNATFTFTDVHTYVYNTYTGGPNATFTLPTASSYQGRILFIKNNAGATAIISNANNVIPQAGGAAGTAICAAGTARFAILVSDGSNWVIMMSA